MPAKTPGQILLEIIDERRDNGTLNTSQLARDLGKSYQTVLRWTRDQGFDEPNQREAARALKIDPSVFVVPDIVESRRRRRMQMFERFLRESEIGKLATERQRRNIRLLTEADIDVDPDMAWFEGQLLMLRNDDLTKAQIDRSIKKNSALDDVLKSSREKDLEIERLRRVVASRPKLVKPDKKS